MASEKVLRIDPRDNVLVALTPLPAGEPLTFGGEQFVPLSEIPAKQKFAIRDLAVGDEVIMYGGIVGLIRQAIPRGGLLSTRNVQHDASGFGPKVGNYSWSAPDVSAWSSRNTIRTKTLTVAARKNSSICWWRLSPRGSNLRRRLRQNPMLPRLRKFRPQKHPLKFFDSPLSLQ